MKLKIIFGILIVGLLAVAGCRSLGPIPGVQTLKQYYEHKPLGEDQGYMPLELAARAKISEIKWCKDDIEYIQCVDEITLADEDGFSRTYAVGEVGEFPAYFVDVLKEGDTCIFGFDRYVNGKIILVNECRQVSWDEIEKARVQYEKEFGMRYDVMVENEVAEFDGKNLTLVKVYGDGGIIVNYGGDYATIPQGGGWLFKCVKVSNEFVETGVSLVGNRAGLLIEKGNLCDDVIVNPEPNGNLKDDFVAGSAPKITKEKAIEIAKNAGLEGNPDNWRTQYYLYTSLNVYVWSVDNTSSSTGSGQSYSAGGKSIIIRADTGEIITESNWMAIA